MYESGETETALGSSDCEAVGISEKEEAALEAEEAEVEERAELFGVVFGLVKGKCSAEAGMCS